MPWNVFENCISCIFLTRPLTLYLPTSVGYFKLILHRFWPPSAAHSSAWSAVANRKHSPWWYLSHLLPVSTTSFHLQAWKVRWQPLCLIKTNRHPGCKLIKVSKQTALFHVDTLYVRGRIRGLYELPSVFSLSQTPLLCQTSEPVELFLIKMSILKLYVSHAVSSCFSPAPC